MVIFNSYASLPEGKPTSLQTLQFFVVSMKSQRTSKEQMRHPDKVSHIYKVVSKFATPAITRSIYII